MNTMIKIQSNPYDRQIAYFSSTDEGQTWESINNSSINSKLREDDPEKVFLPFNAKEIIDTIIYEYYVDGKPIELIFEGTGDEFGELNNICNDPAIIDKVHLLRSSDYLEDARDILGYTKEEFNKVYPIISKIVRDDEDIIKGCNKVSDALKDIIPICIFGNYSAGKSTFINALIGYEILPSGGDPVTAKVFQIERSAQDDRAKIAFTYLGEEFEIGFTNSEYDVKKGDKEKDIIVKIINDIEAIDDKCLFLMVNQAISTLNSFEKRDKTTMTIGNVVQVEVPFSKAGALGRSSNKFVIFDTPGSNSNSNIEHKKVLSDALDGFSNGIPMWVSSYESIDSVDNAKLCDDLYQIDALDKRFTMIVVNKADSVQLPKNGLGKDDITIIMEYESVEKMYSSGIYFVSSIMGLGAKNKDKLESGIRSEYLMEVFDDNEKKFKDPESRFYKKLYEYNIMPEQIKQNAIRYSTECMDIIYANSGLLCIEMEIEQFASKYAAYNKCQMVYIFLKSVIDETAKRIAEKTANREKNRERLKAELSEKEKSLIDSINNQTHDFNKYCDEASKIFVREYVKEELVFEYSIDDLENLDNKISEHNEKNADFESYEKEYEGAKDNLWKNFVENSQELFKGNGFLESAKNIAISWVDDFKVMQEKKETLRATRKDVDKITSDELMNYVINAYKNNIMTAQEKIGEATRNYWDENTQRYRDEMVQLVKGTDSLSEKQRNELYDIILGYPNLEYTGDDADKVFIKANFLRGAILGLKFGDSERLNILSLSNRYNKTIDRNIKEISMYINDNYSKSFKIWQDNLLTRIKGKITELNPQLRELSSLISDETELINELQNNQQTINNSFVTIEKMMAWKQRI